MNTLSIYSSASFTIVVGAIHYSLSRVATQFNDVFEGFGADLPWLTNIMLPDSLYYWLVPLSFGICYIVHHLGFLSRPAVLLVSSVGTILSISLCIVGLYLPIFQLGAVVSS